MKGKTVHELKPGDHAEFSKTLSESDVYLFAGITGDFNPAHVNEHYAQGTFFKTRIAHGMLAASFISTVMATSLPGPGTIYIKQDLRFLAPLYINDTVTASVEILEADLEKNRVLLKTQCKNQEGTLLVDGQALVSPPK